MQIQTGSAVATHGSPTIVASAGNDWSAATVGSLFGVVTDGVFYSITAITAPGASVSTRWELTLSANYAGADNGAAVYVIAVDFTPNFSLPLINSGDSATAALFSKAMQILDAALQAAAPTGSLAGNALKLLRVNAAATAIEYVPAPATGIVFSTIELQTVTAGGIDSAGNWLCLADLSGAGHFGTDFIEGLVECRRGDDESIIAKSSVVLEASRTNAETLALVVYVPALPLAGYAAVPIHLYGKVRGIDWSAPGTVSFAPNWTFQKLA